MLSHIRAFGYNLVALRRYSSAPTYHKDSVAEALLGVFLRDFRARKVCFRSWLCKNADVSLV
jgi:hypothetical protein